MAYLKTLGAIDFYSNTATVGCGLTSTGVIAGTGSLRIWKGTGTIFVVQAARNTAPSSFLSGYGYFRWKLTTALPDGARIGYYFLPQQHDVSGLTGRVWSVWIFRDADAFTLNIHEYPNGLAGANGAAGIQVPLTPLYSTLNVVYSVALKWILDLPRYGGLWVRAWMVQGTTLPDLTTAPHLEYTFALSVAPTSFGEGEWYRLQSTIGGNVECIIDQVGRYALLVP